MRIAVTMFMRLTRQAENVDDGERQEHADGVRESPCAARHGERDREARSVWLNALAMHQHHPVGDGDAEQRADRGGEQVVGEALEQEQLDEVARRVPTARAMPSSPRRSAASMTKIRKISRMPAAIENEPNVVNIDMNAAPCCVGELERVALGLVGLQPSGASVGRKKRDDAGRSRRAGDGSPRFETRTF